MTDINDDKEKGRNSDVKYSKEEQHTDESTDNVTPDKPDHARARASVFVDGLSVLGFNSAENRAEFGFFKDMHFPVEMYIFDKDCNLYWSTETESDFPYSTLGVEIKVNTTETGMGSRYENSRMDGEDFRMDDEDFRHLPSLPNWHGAAKMDVRPDPRNIYISARLNIYDAVFYTYKLSQNDATKYENTPSGPINEVPLGKIGRIPGGDIFCSPEENLEIEIKPLNVSDSIKVTLKENGSPYLIVVRVRANDEHNHTSHLVHLYNVLKRPGGDARTFALRFSDIEPMYPFCGFEVESNQFECQVFVDSGGGW